MNRIISIVLALVSIPMLLSEPEADVTYTYMCVWYLTAFLIAGASYLLWKSEG